MSSNEEEDWRAARRREDADLEKLKHDNFLVGEAHSTSEDRLQTHRAFDLSYCLACFLCCGNDRKKLYYIEDEEEPEFVSQRAKNRGSKSVAY